LRLCGLPLLVLTLCLSAASPAFCLSEDVPLAQQVGQSWWQELQLFWNARVWVIEGNPVTVGKIVLSASILVFGGLLGHFLSRRIREKLVSVFDVGPGTAHGIERLLFYVVMVVIFLTALKTVGIPLTAFAFAFLGVAYGSPAREVEALLLGCADDHPEVLKFPRPYVIFRDFVESALVFDLYFWVDFKVSTRHKVESDLRFMIVDLFEARGITISFPQRDVHLDTAGPIDVRLLSDGPSTRN